MGYYALFPCVMSLSKTQVPLTYGYANIFMFGFGDRRSLCFMCDCFGGRTFLFYNGRCNKYCYKGGIVMPDYKMLYLTLLDGVEKAIETLKNVEIACEDIYIDSDETVE